ncbi:MAG: hypothetical protein MJ006_00165 [Methanocorpusculum sp.]|nr:hypothetical protein [Methanocorpusculum sp.]
MKGKVIMCILLALALFCIPAAAADAVSAVQPPAAGGSAAEESPGIPLLESPVMLNGENNYGYLHVNSVQVNLKNTDADFIVTYDIDPWIAFLVSVFGTEDLKKRVLGVLQYPDAGYTNQVITFQYLDVKRAVLHITNAALDNQDNSYWYRAHTFGCTIPNLYFLISDSDVRNFTNVKEMSRGIGYFKS